jgi:hypothetical protein
MNNEEIKKELIKFQEFLNKYTNGIITFLPIDEYLSVTEEIKGNLECKTCSGFKDNKCHRNKNTPYKIQENDFCYKHSKIKYI